MEEDDEGWEWEGVKYELRDIGRIVSQGLTLFIATFFGVLLLAQLAHYCWGFMQYAIPH